MGNQFHAAVQRSVALNIQVLCIFVGDIQDFTGILAALAVAVDLQFHTKEAFVAALAVKNQPRCVAVIVDRRLLQTSLQAVITQRFVLLIIFVVASLYEMTRPQRSQWV